MPVFNGGRKNLIARPHPIVATAEMRQSAPRERSIDQTCAVKLSVTRPEKIMEGTVGNVLASRDTSNGLLISGASTVVSQRVRRARRRILLISTVIFITVQAFIVVIGFAGMAITNVSRSYVTGEALYSKSQKESVISLMRFASAGHPEDYASFEYSNAVHNGDHVARLALEEPRPDLKRAERGFLLGRNSPADVSTMIDGFLWFQGWRPFALAVQDWRSADTQFTILQQLGEKLKREREQGKTPTALEFDQIKAVDSNLSVIEQRFSDQMGSVARLATDAAYITVGLLSLSVCMLGLILGWRVQKALTLIGEELAEQRDKAEEAARAKSEFLANMSHEIRTPLTGIIGFARVLDKRGDLPVEAGGYVDRIVSSSNALLAVVNDLLDFSKLDAGRVELESHPFQLKRFLSETTGLLQGQALSKNLCLDYNIDPDVPEILLADSARMRQVLLNFLSNAVKFTETGGITVTATYLAPEQRLKIAVRDTGIGITENSVARLFQRFSQVDGSNTRQQGGTGLGLAISKGLVELMDGQVGVESTAGAGSTFWFTIKAPVVSEPIETAEPLLQDDDIGFEKRLKILVVDDVAANRELVSIMLQPFEIDITLATNGEQAVQEAMLRGFDLILMDLQMPGMDGLAATASIRANSEINRHTPIVALSANVMPPQVQACLDAGMNDHIGKPIQPEILLNKIVKWTSIESDDHLENDFEDTHLAI